MGHQQIRTQWHKIAETLGSGEWDYGRVAVLAASGEMQSEETDLRTLRDMVQDGDDLPKFFFEEELIHKMSRGDIEKSIGALHDAGIFRLPYPSLIAEFNLHGVHHAVILMESEDLQKKTENPFCAIPIWIDGGQILLSPTVTYFRLERVDGALRVRFEGRDAFYLPKGDISTESIKKVEHTITSSCGVALYCSVLLLNTRGVDKEHVVCERLNRVRAQTGKRPVPEHTVIRIGHVYDRSGNAVSVGGRGPMPVHWRRGHTRQQRIGHGRTGTKLVYIEPCLVNYVEGEEKPRPRDKEVAW